MKARGVTLLETLVALACAAMVLAALYGAVLRTTVAQARATAHADRIAAARGVLLSLASELEAAPAAGFDRDARFAVAPPPDGGPAWQTLRFVTGARGPAIAADDLPVVDYRVAADGGDGRGTLVRSETPRRAPPRARGPDPVALVDAVRHFRVRCFDGRAWSSIWRVLTLPRAVELTLGVDDGTGGVEEVATTVTIPAGGI